MKAPKETKPLTDKDFLSIGVTLLDLATYGRINGGLLKGHIYRYIGRSQTSKSFLSRTTLAEAARNPNFNDYELIHDDVEQGVLLDNLKFFGPKLASRIKAPTATKQGEPIFSRTLDDFYDVLGEKLKKGTKIIWIEDSLDSLLPPTETKMGDGKAKIHSQQMRKLIAGLKATGSILILICHAKPNMGFAWGGDITTGGLSPEFYSTLDIWLTKMGTIKKDYEGKKYPIGVNIKAHIKKNRISGVDREVKFPLYFEIGIDDVGANVDFMCEYGPWKKVKGVITVDEFSFQGGPNKLIRHIEKEKLQRELQIMVSKVWKEIEDACSLKRVSRYH